MNLFNHILLPKNWKTPSCRFPLSIWSSLVQDAEDYPASVPPNWNHPVLPDLQTYNIHFLSPLQSLWLELVLESNLDPGQQRWCVGSAAVFHVLQINSTIFRSFGTRRLKILSSISGGRWVMILVAVHGWLEGCCSLSVMCPELKKKSSDFLFWQFEFSSSIISKSPAPQI